MHFIKVIFIFFLIGLNSCLEIYGQSSKDNDIWVLFTDAVKGDQGYRNIKGDIVIPLGKYPICFSDTFRTYAVVAIVGKGFMAIDREEHILYEVYPFDKGPDDPEDGFFRIIENKKIGYANAETGKVVIKPMFDCAFPFENGVAKVSTNCTTQSDGEHSTWISDQWFYIEKTGKRKKAGK